MVQRMNKQKHGGNSRTTPESTTIEHVMSEESISDALSNSIWNARILSKKFHFENLSVFLG